MGTGLHELRERAYQGTVFEWMPHAPVNNPTCSHAEADQEDQTKVERPEESFQPESSFPTLLPWFSARKAEQREAEARAFRTRRQSR